MFNFFRFFIVMFVLCSVTIAAERTSTVSITIKVYSTVDSSAVKNYAAALYDSSGTKIDSLVAVDTNLVRFSNVPITGLHSSGELPTGYFLGQNYPNPFNPSSRIRFSVPQAGPVSFKTYTILGQEDASLEMMLEPGNYEVQYDPGGAAGVLFYRLITKEFTETKKMVQFGGEKSGKSSLTLVSSGLRSPSQSSRMAAGVQTSCFVVKLCNLPTTYLPIRDTTIRIAGPVRDTTLDVYVAETKEFSCPGTPTVTYAGKTYSTVLIGTQCWLKQSLNVGTMIDRSQDQTNNSVIEKYCYYNDTANCNMYGGLYQWGEAMQYSTMSGAQGICPSGWHIPTYAELQTLIDSAGSSNALLAAGQGSGTNASGFSCLLAGYRGMNGWFNGVGSSANIWSSTEYSSGLAYSVYVIANSNMPMYDYNVTHGFSVRCIKD